MKYYSKKLALLGGFVLSTRLLTGAIHVLFLMNRGMSLQDLAYIQILCSTTILVMGYPVGLFADLKGSKLCVLLSLGCYAIYYPCCLMAPNILVISLGSVCYSIGITTFQTTFQSWLVQTIRNEYPNQPNQIDHYTHLNAEYNALGSMILTPLATFFASNISMGYEILYCLAMTIMVLLMVVFTKIPSSHTNYSNNQNLLSSLKSTFYFCSKDILAKYFLLYSILYAAVFQLTHHFWQPLFADLNKESILSNSMVTGTLFFFVSFGQYISNRYIRYLFTKKTLYWEISIFITFFASIAFLGVGSFKNLFIAGLFYIMIHICLMIGEAVADHQIMKTFPSCYFASLYSLKGVIGRIGAVLSLFIIKDSLNLYSIQKLYKFYSVLVICTLFPLYILKQRTKKI